MLHVTSRYVPYVLRALRTIKSHHQVITLLPETTSDLSHHLMQVVLQDVEVVVRFGPLRGRPLVLLLSRVVTQRDGQLQTCGDNPPSARHANTAVLLVGVGVATWEGLRDDLVLHDDVRDLGLDLHRLPGQLGEDLLAEQHVLSRLQLHVPRLGSCGEDQMSEDAAWRGL